MSEHAPVLVEVGAAPRPGPGGRLQAARVERGLEVASAADALRVTPRIIEALEADRFEVFDAPVYARGFLRTYARFVGVPAEEVLAAYDALAGEQAEPSLIPPTSAGPLQRDYGRFKIVGVFALALLLVGASYWWWMTRSALVESPPPASVTAAPAASVPLANVTPDTSDVELALPPLESVSDKSVPAAAAPAAAGATVAPNVAKIDSAPPATKTATATAPGSTAKPAAAAAAPLAASSVTLPAPQAKVQAKAPAPAVSSATGATPTTAQIVLRVRSDCWVEVRGAGGVRLYYGLLKAGQTQVIDGPAPWFVFLGYAYGVDLTVAGKQVEVPESRRDGVKARFGLNADGTVR